MTADMMDLRTLVEKAPDVDVLREMIAFAAERLMEIEVAALTGAGHGEKSSTRLAQRNGYRDRDWGRPEPARSSCASPSCATAATSRASSSPGACPRRRLRQ